MTTKKIEKLYVEARQLALEQVIQEARKIMTKHPQLEEFVMGMGTWFFHHKDGSNVDGSDLVYLKPLSNFIDEWDFALKLTGEGIRFTATGEIVTDW